MRKIKDNILLSLAAIPIGAIVGAICALFGRVLLIITAFRQDNPKYLIPFLAFGGMAVVFAYNKIGKGSEKGMSLMLNASYGDNGKIPLQLVPLILVGTWVTHLFGGSAGREGVAVQIGGAISHNIGRKIKIEDADRILVISGMAAGFAGLFQTPLAAILFAIEITFASKLIHKAVLPSIASAFTSCYVSHLCGLEKFSVKLIDIPSFDIKTIQKTAIISIAFGLTGCAFAYLEKKLKAIASSKIKNNIIRIGAISVFISITLLLLHNGRYAGLGTNLISAVFDNEKIYTYDFMLKFILTIITLSAGFQGGEVTPLFSIGASLGSVLGALFGLPSAFVGALGYASVFGSATNTLFAPILIGYEVFGYKILPYVAISCVISYIVNFNQSIYPTKKRERKNEK